MSNGHGPYDTRAQADGDMGPAASRAARTTALTTALADADVKLGEFDQDVADWFAGFQPGTVQVVIGWIARANTPATSKAGTWVIYCPIPGEDLLQPTGTQGSWDGHRDPADLAGSVLARFADGHPDWVVKVYGPNEKLTAWAEWDNGAPAVHSAPAKKERQR